MLRADMLSDSLVAYTWHRAKYFLTLFRPVHTSVTCNWCVTYPIIAQDVKLLYEIRDVDILQNQGDAFRSRHRCGRDKGTDAGTLGSSEQKHRKGHAEGKGANETQQEAPQEKCLSRGPPGNLFYGEQGHTISNLARIMCSTKC